METTPTLTLATGAGDTCPSCGAPLSADQRYCVECGERQSGARPRTPGTGERVTAAPVVPAPRRRLAPTTSAGVTLIAGVGTLLVAMAVGVLIGRSGSQARATTSAAAPRVRVISVPAGGTQTAADTPTPAPKKAKVTAKHAHKRSGGGHAKSAADVAKAAGVPVQQTQQAAGSSTPPPVVTEGSPGHGKGYTNGHFTGNFFGGG